MFKLYTTLIACVICYHQLVAQLEQFRFKTWDQQKGLPANSCLSAMQDRNGYIWVSTVNGISRFNGISFKEIEKYDDTLSIEGEVRRTIQDSDGVYWIASYEKGLINIDYSQPKEKQIQAFNPSTLKSGVCPPFQSVNRLLDDKAGHIWVGTEADGLYRFDKKTKVFIRWKFKNPHSKFSESIRCLYQHQDGTIWVGIVNGIVYINPGTGETIYPKTTYTGISYAHPPTVRNICHWNSDTFAVATDRGAYFYRRSAQTFTPVFQLEDSLQYKNLEYHDVIKFSDNELWFATIDRGIWRVNFSKKEYSYSWKSNIAGETIGRHPVYYFYKDRKNHLWVCHSKGLSYLNQQNTRFQNLPFSFHVSQPAAKNFLIADNKDIAIIRPDSLFRWSYADKHPKAVRLLYNKENTGGVQIWKHHRLGYILINPKGIFYADTVKHRAVPLFLNKDLPKALRNTANISQLLIDPIKNNEQWWIGANESTLLYCFNWRSGAFIAYDIFKEAGKTEKKTGVYFSRMVKDPKGGIWIGTRNQGLFYMPDRTKDVFMHFTPDQSAGKQIPGDYIEDLITDNSDNLWATIRGVGLVFIDWRHPQNLKYSVYAKERGLTYLNLGEMRVDDRNNLWIGSPNGLFCFDQNKKWFNYFGQPNGISNPVFTTGSAKDSAGNMYFASTDHLLRFNPATFINKESDAVIQLLSITVNDRTVSITNKQTLKLKPDENTIKFEFDVLDFDNPTGHYVLCKLDGYDREWLLLQDVFQQTYRSLPAGNYTFRIKKVMLDGAYDKEITQAVSIADYYYNTTWFRIIATVFTALLFLGGVRLYVNWKMQKQKVLLEKRQAIEMERLRISSELHDDLGGGLSTIRLLSEMMRQGDGNGHAQEQLLKISENSKELVEKMNEIVWALNVKNDNLESLLFYIRKYTVQFLDTVDIIAEVSLPEAIADVEVSGEKRRDIFLMVKEILHNVVKHSSASKVVMNIKLTADLSISIRDNGKGMTSNVSQTSPGNGLANLERRINSLNGSLTINTGNGTELTLSVPVATLYNKSVIAS